MSTLLRQQATEHGRLLLQRFLLVAHFCQLIFKNLSFGQGFFELLPHRMFLLLFVIRRCLQVVVCCTQVLKTLASLPFLFLPVIVVTLVLPGFTISLGFLKLECSESSIQFHSQFVDPVASSVVDLLLVVLWLSDVCGKQFVLTVPAVWSDKAKDTTVKAAKQAGLHPLALIKEPEAAAMYTLHMLRDKALSIGDAFVICDAGGGTFDLISYEITQSSPRLELKELVPGKGGMAGSLGLNKRFEEAVKDVVGEDQYIGLRKTKGFELALLDFDQRVKIAFRGDTGEDYYINFPFADLVPDPEKNLFSNCWIMKGNDLKAIFDPLIVDIERLVDEQVNLVKVKRLSDGHLKANEIKAIFLVGGFGSNQYLKACLEKNHSHIQIIQPHGAWEAIVKGAVLSQLPEEAVIVSNQATRHYGVNAMFPFQPDRDADQTKTFGSITGEDRVHLMTWYILRGKDLMREQVVKFPFYRSLPEGFANSQLIFTDELIQSESKTPPVHPSPSTTKVNCVLTADLSGVDRSHFPRVTGKDDNVYYEVHYDLLITIKPAMMKFSLELKGKEMGTVNAVYD